MLEEGAFHKRESFHSTLSNGPYHKITLRPEQWRQQFQSTSFDARFLGFLRSALVQ